MADENEEIPVVKEKVYKSLRYFLSDVGSPVTSSLVKTIQEDKQQNPENPHLILGTSKDKSIKNVQGIKRIIDSSRLSFLKQVLLESDVIVYDLNNCDYEECELAIKTLQMGEYTDTKFLICISSVMVWSNTSPKEKKGDDEEDEGDEPDSEPEEEGEDKQEEKPQLDENGEEIPKKQYVKFKESDFALRKPLPKYDRLKQLETLCLSASISKQNLKSYVLCSGILYGNQEFVFYDQFRQAWLQSPQVLNFYGNGKNRIPCVHVKDLAQYVVKTVEKQPKNQYIFAIDHNKKSEQKKIIQAFAKGIGAGIVASSDLGPNYNQHSDNSNNYDVFMLDVRLQPSKSFDPVEGEEEPAEPEEGEEAPYRFSFDWHCKEGIQKNIAKIREEFNIYNDLKPNKIFLTGPPASGKTYYSKQLQQFYNVPYICVKDVVDEVLALNNEFSEEIKAALEEVRGSMAEQEQEKMDKLKEKREKQGLPINDADYEVIPEKLNPRIPDNLLYKAFKWRLMKNDCQNRGFILDGYGRNYQDAKGLFLKNKPQENEDEPVDEENPVLVRDENICPDHVILLQASNEQLTERIKNLSEEQLSESTHFDEQGLNRRLKLYRDQNENEDGRPSLLQFLQQQNIDVLSVSVSNNNLFDTIKSFVQRNGKYKNFMTFEDEQERQRVENTQKIQQQKKLDYENYNREMDRKEQEQRELVEEIYKLEQEDQRKKDSETLEQQSLPLRQYLQKNLVPFLSDGLLYVIKNKHEDPVDFLAEYLFKRSLEVPYTDPLKFKLSNNSV